jgi:putative heme-binding domain-containing protein
MHVVTTGDGRILTGIVLERTVNRLIVQTATERVVLASKDVEEVVESAASMMPEAQLSQLTTEQIRDLVAYLATPAQVPLPEVTAGGVGN